MEFNNLAKKRYSCRKYSSRKVEKDILLQILEAGRIAPSAVNYQPRHFIAFDQEPQLSSIKECYHREWFKTAPIVILLCSDHNQSWKRDDGKDHADIDIAIAADHITLAATSLGLATCWVCNFDPVKISSQLNLPRHIEPTVLLSLGYPEDSCDENRHLNKRKPLNEIVYFNHFKL